MKTIKMTAAMAAALALLSGCGGGGGDGGSAGGSEPVDAPVGAWTSLDAAEATPRTGRQLYVLPPESAGGQSEAWGLEFEVVDSASNPTTLVNALLTAGASTLTGRGGVQDLAAVPSVYTALPSVSVVPSVSGSTLTVVAGTASWTLTQATLLAATDGLWTGAFTSTAGGGALGMDWSLVDDGTLTASNETASCTYAGSVAAVGHADLPGVVRISFASNNTDTTKRAECGDWQGMGTVARDVNGNVAGRTLWLRKTDGTLLQRVSLSPATAG